MTAGHPADQRPDRRDHQGSLRDHQLNAAKTSSRAFIGLPVADEGTRISVCTPAARHAATPSRTFAAGPNSVLSASHLSEKDLGTSSPRPSASAFSIAVISST